MVEKSNAHIFKSVLKHPKLSKVVGDAFDAPIGSTKRTQALAMLNSIYKVSGRRFPDDGQGGEEKKSNLDKYLPYLSKEADVYDRLMIFNAAPEMKKDTKQDGRGGPGDLALSSYDPSNIQSKFANINLKIDPSTGNLYDPADLLKGYRVQQEDVKNQPVSGQYEGLQIGRPSPGERITPKTAYPGITSQMPSWGPSKKDIQIELPKQTKKVKTGIVINGVEQTVDVPVEEEKKPITKPTTKKPLWGPELDGYKVKGAEKKQAQYGPSKPSGVETTTVAQERADKMYQEYINAGMSDEQARSLVEGYVGTAPSGAPAKKETGAMEGPSQYTGLQKMAEQAAGPESFYGDVSLLPLAERRKLFPGVADELLPATTTEIRTTLEKETNLKEWENKQKELAMQGNYVIPDMKEYIRNRDEYISDIDKNISNTMYKLSHLRTGDPREEQDLKNNLTYLNVLKGRQTQRYTDMLNTSIESFNKEAERVNMGYQQAKVDFERRLTGNLEYQQGLKNRLAETWNSIRRINDPSIMLEQETKQLQNQKAQLEILESIKKLSTNAAIDSEVLKQMPTNDKYLTDSKTGALLPSSILDIPGKVSFLLQGGQDPHGIIQSLGDAIDRKVDLSAKDFPALYKEIRGLTGQIYNLGKNRTLNESIDSSGRKIDGNIVASDLTMRLLEKSKMAFKDYMQSKKNDIRDAIKALTPGDWFYNLPSKDSWVKTYSDKGLDKDLLNDVYDYYVGAKDYAFPKDPENSRALFTGYDSSKRPIKKIDDSNIDTIINMIYRAVSNSYLRPYNIELPTE